MSPDAREEECMRRVSEVLRASAPTDAEIAAARRRFDARARARRSNVGFAFALAAGAAAIIGLGVMLRRPAPSVQADPSRAVTQPVVEAPAAGPDPAQLAAAKRDEARLAEAEALHRSGHCGTAKPTLEELAASGATPEVRAHAQKLLDEIAKMGIGGSEAKKSR